MILKIKESLVTAINDMVKMHTRNSVKIEKSEIERFVVTLLALSNLSEYDINLEVGGVLYPVTQYEVLPGFEKLIAPAKVSVEAGHDFVNLKEGYEVDANVKPFTPIELMKFNDLVCSALRIPFGKDRVAVSGVLKEVTVSSVLKRTVYADRTQNYDASVAGLPISLKFNPVNDYVFLMPVKDYLTWVVRDIFISLTADRK